MELYVLIEAEYKNSSWCKNIIRGLNDEKKRKKVKLKYISALDELPLNAYVFNNSVILIGSKPVWITENIYKVLSLNLKPILINNTQFIPDCASCSIVSSDVLGAVTDAYTLFKENNKTSIALYGVNPESVADTVRKNSFLSIGGKEKDVYYNNGLLKGCFYSFLPNFSKYDAILCVNDFIAISLINHLKNENLHNNLPAIISLSSSLLGGCFSPKISSYAINYEKFGAAAILINEVISKNEYISSVNSLIKYDFFDGETTKGFNTKIKSNQPINNPNDSKINIYTDLELAELMAVEAFLKSADELDYLILKMSKSKMNIEKISESTFLSVSTIKYRKKNLCNIFKVKNIVDVFYKLEKYISL